MSLVAIFGAGEMGGAVARALAARGNVDMVRLIDESSTIAAGKALDLAQSTPVLSSDTKIEGSQDFSAAAGARVVVIADSATADGEWTGESGLALLRRLNRSGYLQQ